MKKVSKTEKKEVNMIDERTGMIFYLIIAYFNLVYVHTYIYIYTVYPGLKARRCVSIMLLSNQACK